ncbi:hypothetical protein BOTBODRAFT_182866 [Botryobasidium botryosum FD-172 SS1]|uniref:Transcription factor domain-containing protein n=1 Tax=Botryobasidium botryosum (strain FD-172 SS1) TaxID=930990 RepID=A0A067NBQ3_BOTB1|nr:hypothetical protein BOTBODRAFT_182866 [Botryobasidium botryosum FD-172 SS1]
MMFGVACGLPAVRLPEWHPFSTPSLLPHTHSRVEIQRRIRLWWTMFTINRFISLTANVKTDVDDEIIETVWELPSDSENIDPEVRCGSVSSLFACDNRSTYVYHDTANAVRSKCAALVERAARFGLKAASASDHDRVFWEKFEAIDEAIRHLTGSLPSVYEESRYEAGAAHIELRTTQMNRLNICCSGPASRSEINHIFHRLRTFFTREERVNLTS